MQRLSEIITEPRTFWNVLHTEIQPCLKVTLEQSEEIASHFFSSEMRFAFSLDSFLNCTLCDIQGIKSVDEAVDIFYCVVGFLQSCHLDSHFEVKAPEYIEFVVGLLTNPLAQPDFDAHQFVWLVESVREHFHLSAAAFRRVCESVLNTIRDLRLCQTGLNLLEKVSIISSSPSLGEFPVLAETVDKIFALVVVDMRNFVQTYIFSCYVRCGWDRVLWDESPIELCLPLRLWKIYLKNYVGRVRSHPEIPGQVVAVFLDISLHFFESYYGEVQAIREYARKLRMDLLEIVMLIKDNYPGTMTIETKTRLWFLLFLVAVSGAEDQDLIDISQKDCDQADDVFLGLEHSEKDFVDYKEALCRLSKKLEASQEVRQNMVQFVRKKYSE
jgi:hypothetical protein